MTVSRLPKPIATDPFYVGGSLWFGPVYRLQSCLEPWGKFFVCELSTGNSRHGVSQRQILHYQPIPAPDNQQLHQVDGRALVAVHEAVIGNDAVDQSRRLLVESGMVAVVGPGERGLDGWLVEDSRGSARQKCFVVGADRVGPGDSVVGVSDLPGPSWPYGAEPRPP